MKRIIALILILLMAGPVQAAQWRNASDTGTAENTLLGAENVSDADLRSYTDIVTPLDSLLTNYREGMDLVYDTANQFTVTSGEVAVKNSAGTTKLFLYNSGSTTVTWADIDTGAEASNTAYYVYAIAASSSATAATFKISTSSSAPSGVTYYKRIGSFTNDSGGSITVLSNDNTKSSISAGTVADGGTISVPTGFSADECGWTVASGAVDTGTSIGGALNKLAFTVTSARVATCTGQRYNWVDSVVTATVSGTCNYIISCTK